VELIVKIYVGNLPKNTDEQTVRDLFQKHGEVVDVKLIKDRFSGELRGFGFIEMPSKTDAQKAIQEVDGTELEGNKLIVNEARPQTDKSGRHGRSGSARGSGGKHHGGSGSRSW
jgi:RNA recognition motif-containing protein